VGVFPINPHETSLVHSGLPRGLKGLLHMLNAIVISTKVSFSIFFYFFVFVVFFCLFYSSIHRIHRLKCGDPHGYSTGEALFDFSAIRSM